jgi:ABC-type branched-subunit amino acid transport system ATPase component
MQAQHAAATTCLAEECDHGAIVMLYTALDGEPAGANAVTPRPSLLAVDGTRLELPRPVVELLAQVIAALARHEVVTIVPGKRLLTTQEAATRLAISRPTLIQLLRDGEIPFEYAGPATEQANPFCIT